MKPKLLLCLAIILIGVLFGCSTTTHRSVSTAASETSADDMGWQITLRAALTNGDVNPAYMAGEIYFHTVPADAAKILESQPPGELLPFLATLRIEQTSWKTGTVDEWINIVRDGLRGTPETLTNNLSNAKGAVVSKTEIPVYSYSDYILRPWIPATNGLQMSLSVLKTDSWDDPGFEIAFQNMGEQVVILNLGFMLANGKVQLPTQIHLRLVDGSGRSRELDFADGPIAGRVDDYVVPLRSGSTYILKLRLDQFWSPSTKEFDLKLKPGRYWVSALFQGTGAETRNSDTTGMRLMNFWKGKLQSNVFEFSE